MAGVTDAIDLEDARGIADFMVAMGRIPPLHMWADGLIEKAKANEVEGLF